MLTKDKKDSSFLSLYLEFSKDSKSKYVNNTTCNNFQMPSYSYTQSFGNLSLEYGTHDIPFFKSEVKVSFMLF